MPAEDPCPGLDGDVRDAGLHVGCQGALQVSAVPHGGGCGQQPGGCEETVGLPVHGQVVSGVELADVVADRGGKTGVREVLAERPGPAEQSADHSQVGEGAGGVLGGMLGAEQGEQGLLGIQGFLAGAGKAVLAGLVQANAAGSARPARSQGPAALDRVKAGGGREGDQQPPRRAPDGWLPGCGCGQPSRRNRWCRGQVKAIGRCQIFCHGPPYCCWTGLPSPSRQSGQ